jgi:hypothetical protein
MTPTSRWASGASGHHMPPLEHQAQGPGSSPTGSRSRALPARSWGNCGSLVRPSPVILLKRPGAHCSWHTSRAARCGPTLIRRSYSRIRSFGVVGRSFESSSAKNCRWQQRRGLIAGKASLGSSATDLVDALPCESRGLGISPDRLRRLAKLLHGQSAFQVSVRLEQPGEAALHGVVGEVVGELA